MDCLFCHRSIRFMCSIYFLSLSYTRISSSVWDSVSSRTLVDRLSYGTFASDPFNPLFSSGTLKQLWNVFSKISYPDSFCSFFICSSQISGKTRNTLFPIYPQRLELHGCLQKIITYFTVHRSLLTFWQCSVRICCFMVFF